MLRKKIIDQSESIYSCIQYLFQLRMAKWGEGDPRWLVSQREDGKNVNSWHWEEVNKLQWCKERLEQLLVGVGSCSTAVDCKITQVVEVKGEALLTRRKGNKKFAVYDLSMEMKWEGKFKNKQDKKVKGKISISEFASSLEREDYIFNVSCDGGGTLEDDAKIHAAQLQNQIYEQLEVLIQELNEML
eukprot:TRINITY_DN2139_c0_g1_i3.p1 TRINITY_DN2139_c0_g1~~TRINITY_DN2139_c0_g1_i3.p1  ORF type:complete len:187 (-),score=25.05 TRINITY_DN2139_c0_g1_i3:315-875(-)